MLTPFGKSEFLDNFSNWIDEKVPGKDTNAKSDATCWDYWDYWQVYSQLLIYYDTSWKIIIII